MCSEKEVSAIVLPVTCAFSQFDLFSSHFSVGQFLSCSECLVALIFTVVFSVFIWSQRDKKGYRAVLILAVPPVPTRDHPSTLHAYVLIPLRQNAF